MKIQAKLTILCVIFCSTNPVTHQLDFGDITPGLSKVDHFNQPQVDTEFATVHWDTYHKFPTEKQASFRFSFSHPRPTKTNSLQTALEIAEKRLEETVKEKNRLLNVEEALKIEVKKIELQIMQEQIDNLQNQLRDVKQQLQELKKAPRKGDDLRWI